MAHDGLREGKDHATATVIRDTIQFPSEATATRLGLGGTGSGMPTRALLDFTLDHARARNAV